MTLSEFQRQVFAVALASPFCHVPLIRRLTATTISLRIHLTLGGFVDAFCNEQSGTIAFALIRRGQRVFGADNTGGWHIHPFADPRRHEPLPGALSFVEFLAEIEQHDAGEQSE